MENVEQINLNQLAAIVTDLVKVVAQNSADIKKNSDDIKALAIEMRDGFELMAQMTQKGFDEIREELATKPSKEDLFDYADKRILPLELDRDKVKYLHRSEWKKLPPQIDITKKLIEEGLRG